MGRLSRREFLRAMALSAAGPWPRGFGAAAGRQGPPAGEPVIDLHQHDLYFDRTREQLLAHQAAHGVTTTVLLAGEGWMRKEVGGNAECEETAEVCADKFVRFASSDPAESRTADVLRGNVSRGAIGFGELKYHVAVDSPEMYAVYKLADELGVPVLLHFEFEMYNTGLERFDRVLKEFPQVNFIGHAQTWWANISAEGNPQVMYPEGRVLPGGLADRLLGDYSNMYGDLSAYSGLNALTRDPDFTHQFLARHSHKLLWGSDCECHDGKGGGSTRGYCLAERSLAALRTHLHDSAALRRILYENAATLLRLPRPASP
ncbi:MAG TPA: amidohydrolase family protein [Terriglobia bacterium]|nr:amidohydrolase family protein [Terriglobia bacterium]